MKPAALTIDARMWSHSGIGTYLRQLLPRLLPRLDGVPCRALLPPDAAPPDIPGLEARVVDLPVYSPRAALLLHRRFHPDSRLVFCPHIDVPLCRTPVLATVHDLILGDNLRLRVRDLHKRIYAAWLVRRAVTRSVQVIAVSGHTRREILSRYPVDGTKVSVVLNGVAPEWLEPPAVPVPEPAAPFILHVGTFKPHKNIPRLLEAFDLLRPRHPGLRLVLTGGGGREANQDRDTLRMARARAPRVEIRQPRDLAELKVLYRQASLLALPSLDEGFGLPPLEAMACGCPCALAEAGPLPELHRDAAVFFDPRSPQDMAGAMGRILDDGTLRANLAGRGPRHARTFSWDRAADETAAIVRRLLER